jgi:uncharacterized membrane protein YbhN (UPF0104 family)
LTRYARPAAYIILAVVTIYGVYRFATGDSATVIDYWGGKLAVLPLILLMACLDVALEGVGWLWVYSRLGIRSWDSSGARAFLAARAGLLLPAQLGRLIRPDVMTRLQRGTMAECLKAEATTFVLDATSVVTLLAALVAGYTLHPLAAPVAGAVVLAALLFLGNAISERLSGTRLALPKSFWWSGQTVGIVLVEMLGWAAHGVALWLMIRDLPGEATWASSLFYSCASSVVGAGTGLPGGIGATEGLLGMSLRLMNIPAAHLVVAVGAFRLVTFWVWIPIGWLALVTARKRAARLTQDAPPSVIVPAD